MHKILVILGSTSTGKTDLALNVAKKFNGELISADSRQVYKGLDIGTGKMPNKVGKLKKEDGRWIIDEIPIYMYDVVSPKKQYTVADYVQDAQRVVRDIQERGKLPIIVGGTGLYLKALLYGLSNLSIPIDKKLRESLEKLPIIKLQERLKQQSFEKWSSLNNSDSQNPRRLIRAIEIEVGKGDLGDQANKGNGLAKEFGILKIGLTASREILYQRSDARVIGRINQGMIDEAKRLYKKGLSFKRMKQLGLEYRILAEYLSGKIKDEQEFVKVLQRKIHHFTRRQLTWFKKEKDVVWFNIENKDFLNKMENTVAKWYYPS